MSFRMMAFIFLMAFVFPMIMQRTGYGRRPRLSQADRERFEALENDLDYRLDQIEQLGARVSELESRLDFTERLLPRGSQNAPSRVSSAYPSPRDPDSPKGQTT